MNTYKKIARLTEVLRNVRIKIVTKDTEKPAMTG